MTSLAASYHGYRFPPEIISHAVWLYHRFCLSFRDAEDLLAQRGITDKLRSYSAAHRTVMPSSHRRIRGGACPFNVNLTVPSGVHAVSASAASRKTGVL